MKYRDLRDFALGREVHVRLDKVGRQASDAGARKPGARSAGTAGKEVATVHGGS